MVVVSGFANGVLIARYLGPEGRGEYAMVNFMVTILLVLLGEGYYRANVYLASRDASSPRLRAMGTRVLLFGFILALFLFLLGLLPERIYALMLPGIQPVYIRLGLGTALAFVLNRQFQGLYLGLQRYWLYNIFNALPIVIFLVLDTAVLLWTGGLTTFQVLLNFLLSMALVAGLASIQFYSRYPILRHVRFEEIAHGFRYGWRATLAYLFVFLLLRVNLYFVNYASGLADAGLFAVAVNIGVLILRVPNVAGVVLLPRVSQKEMAGKLVLTTKVAVVSLAFAGGAGVFFALFGQPLIITFYSARFADSYGPLVWLLPGIVMFSVAGIYNTLLWGQGFPPVTLWAPLVALVANLLFCLWLIPQAGIVGAAQAASLAQGLFALMVFAYVYRKRSEWK